MSRRPRISGLTRGADAAGGRGGDSGAEPPRLDEGHWRRRLAALAERTGVPGAQLGILRVAGTGDELVTAAYGVLNRNTGVQTTTDSVFHLGSITKVWTATLAMSLVDEGRLDLDAPVVAVLPELRLHDPDATRLVTLRHLLTHTSGIDGDIFTDTGRGDDCLERYAALLAGAAQLHPPGATWSYCNAGFALIGRMIEKVTGKTWDAVVRERLSVPLGLTHTVTLPEEALLYRAALGHLGGTEPTPAPVWTMPRSTGPAALITSTVRDVLSFARLHLTGGLAPDGTSLLSAAATAAMAGKHADLPSRHLLGDSWGLGWTRWEWSGHLVIGHNGNTIGQSAFLRIVPDQGLAVALLTNADNADGLYEDLFREILAAVAEITVPPRLAPAAEPATADATPWLGTYERAAKRIEVVADDDGPVLRLTSAKNFAVLKPGPAVDVPMIPIGTNLFAVRMPQDEHWSPVFFYTLASGTKFLHFGARATPKVG